MDGLASEIYSDGWRSIDSSVCVLLTGRRICTVRLPSFCLSISVSICNTYID